MNKTVYTLYSESLKRIVLTLTREPLSKGFSDGDGCVRILSVTRGEGRISYDGTIENFTEGDTFIFDSGRSFSVVDEVSCEGFLLKFNFSDFIDADYKVFQKERLEGLFKKLEGSCEVLKGIHINAKKIQDTIYMIEEEFENDKASKDFVIKAYLILIISLILQYLFDELDGGGINKSPYYKNIKTSLVYINEHISEKLTLDELAKSANMGKTNFSVAFKLVTGMTVWDYILNSRIELASSYLVEKKDDFNITEIAMLTGFNSAAHFTKVFKRLKGDTPKEFKKNSKNPCF